MLPWFPRVEPIQHPVDPPIELVVIPEEDEKEEELIILTREYCSHCINKDGEIICPRRHRCRVCKCHLDDDEWFAQFKK